MFIIKKIGNNERQKNGQIFFSYYIFIVRFTDEVIIFVKIQKNQKRGATRVTLLPRRGEQLRILRLLSAFVFLFTNFLFTFWQNDRPLLNYMVHTCI